MNKIIFLLLIAIVILPACSKKEERKNIFEKEDIVTTCGNGICEVFTECPLDKNCPASELPTTCPQDCKLSCFWSPDGEYCYPKYTDKNLQNLEIDNHLNYILDKYGCETSLDCPFSHVCTDVKFLDDDYDGGRICIYNLSLKKEE